MDMKMIFMVLETDSMKAQNILGKELEMGEGELKKSFKRFLVQLLLKTKVTPNILFCVPKFKMFIFSLVDKSVAREENFESLFLLLHLPMYIRHNLFLRKP